jgi:hypothetical protein
MSRRNNRGTRESQERQRNSANHGEEPVEEIIIRLELQLNIQQSENKNVRVTRATTTRARWGHPTHSSGTDSSPTTTNVSIPTWDARSLEQRHPSWGTGQPRQRHANSRRRRQQWCTEHNGRSYTQGARRGQHQAPRHANSAEDQEQRRQLRRSNQIH